MLSLSCTNQQTNQDVSNTPERAPPAANGDQQAASEPVFDGKLHVDSYPPGASVYYEVAGDDKRQNSRLLGETPLATDGTSPGRGNLFIAFNTEKLCQQLSAIPELKDVVNEFKAEMKKCRPAFAQGGYAVDLHISQYFRFPSRASKSNLDKSGELLEFGPVFEYNNKSASGRFVAWALPNGKPASSLFSFMPPKGSNVASGADLSWGSIPQQLWPEALECISRCGYYAWIGKAATHNPYASLTVVPQPGEMFDVQRIDAHGED